VSETKKSTERKSFKAVPTKITNINSGIQKVSRNSIKGSVTANHATITSQTLSSSIIEMIDKSSTHQTQAHGM